jgi:hypothetical protein
MSSNRSSIRDGLLSTKVEFKSKIVTVNGVEVEVRQPSVKSRRDLMKRATDGGSVDLALFMVWGVIFNTYVPATNELVFDEMDFDALMEKPVGGFIDQLSEAASEMMNVDEDLENKAKNSSKTQKK